MMAHGQQFSLNYSDHPGIDENEVISLIFVAFITENISEIPDIGGSFFSKFFSFGKKNTFKSFFFPN